MQVLGLSTPIRTGIDSDMDTPFDINVKSLGEAIDQLLKISEDWNTSGPSGCEDPYLWFRGVNTCKHQLVPGAYWRTNYEERRALVELSQRGDRFSDSHELGPWNSWGTYYLAQHYGIPTRLLDWSESFVSALFFAIDGVEPSAHPCVWVLNPNAFNEITCGWPGIISPENNPELDIWSPKEILSHRTMKAHDDATVIYDNEKPLAIFPRHRNSRIRSQSGFFTIHGRDRNPIESIIVMGTAKPQEVIARICFRGIDPLLLSRQVGQIGVRRSAIYPDLENFAKELKGVYGWQ